MPEEFNLSQMERETEEMLQIRYLTKHNTVFNRTEGGFVSLSVGEETYKRIQVIRMFPFMEKDRFLSVRSVGDKSKEIGIIEDLKDMDTETVQLLKEQLNLRYFTPIITKIRSVKEEYGFAYWDVITDHGECRFTIHMGGNAVVHLTEERILLSDIDENRFEIPDVGQLTPAERRKLDLFL
jgi:hypothetical protein